MVWFVLKQKEGIANRNYERQDAVAMVEGVKESNFSHSLEEGKLRFEGR